MVSNARFTVLVPAPDEPVTATTGCFLDIDAPYENVGESGVEFGKNAKCREKTWAMVAQSGKNPEAPKGDIGFMGYQGIPRQD